ncbi:MAG TPA: hypothetical protein VE482_01680 [Candidatus Eisenbacteria bacterium]|nr:hypothetical protein [Candidatus Eisenbacteria bacterium]
MARGDLLSIIKAKQAEIAKLQAELEEARPRLAAIVRSTSVTSKRVARRHPNVFGLLSQRRGARKAGR